MRFVLLALLVLAGAACSGNNKVPVRQLPVQLGHPPRPTPTPPPTATGIPPPPCGSPAADVVSWTQEKGPTQDTHVLSGQVRSNCSTAVDVTLNVRWLDGPERLEGPRAFATLRRVQPGEVRPFSEIVSGGRGATKLDLSTGVAASVVGRRR